MTEIAYHLPRGGSSFSSIKSLPDEAKRPGFNTSPGDRKPPKESLSPGGPKRRGSTAGPADSKRPRRAEDSVRTTRQTAANPIILSYPTDSEDEDDPNDFTMQYSEEEMSDEDDDHGEEPDDEPDAEDKEMSDQEMPQDEQPRPRRVAAKPKTPAISSFIRFPSPKTKGVRFSKKKTQIPKWTVRVPTQGGTIATTKDDSPSCPGWRGLCPLRYRRGWWTRRRRRMRAMGWC